MDEQTDRQTIRPMDKGETKCHPLPPEYCHGDIKSILCDIKSHFVVKIGKERR